MLLPRYEVNNTSIKALCIQIELGELAVPEIQRPFVWNTTMVRDFIDSLYHGYPVGYLIAWESPSVRLKDGTQVQNKTLLIDGQQRVTALRAAILGNPIVDKNYNKKTIRIAFHPYEERFEVTNPAIEKDKTWLPNISVLFQDNKSPFEVVKDYCKANAITNEKQPYEAIDRLFSIQGNSLGFIKLHENLSIDIVSEIFARTNSKGVGLNTADFAMTKMAANETHRGHELRKCIDYFCHLAIEPDAYADLMKDKQFAVTKYFKAMSWLKDNKDDLYDPSYIDMLRVTFTSEFKRGKLNDLIALLSGRNFKTKICEEEIVEESFQRLEAAVLRFMNKNNFTKFTAYIMSAGFVDSSMIRSKNVLNFAYIVYLTLKHMKVSPPKIHSLVQRWLVMSVLTGRYSGSSETAFDADIRNIHERSIEEYLNAIEEAEMSDTFWDTGLPQQLDNSTKSGPYYVFLASQVKASDKGFLSQKLTVQNLLFLKGISHVHHVFPKSYLKQHGLPQRQYNQLANYVVVEDSINLCIGDTPPNEYLSNPLKYGGITDSQLKANLKAHCIPQNMDSFDINNYDEFLTKRRILMSHRIRDFYRSL